MSQSSSTLAQLSTRKSPQHLQQPELMLTEAISLYLFLKSLQPSHYETVGEICTFFSTIIVKYLPIDIINV